MNRDDIATYLFQFNFQTEKSVYLPYSVGILWTYASTTDAVKSHYEHPRFVFMKDDPEKIVERMQKPDIAAFSSYVWNWEISTQTARLVKERFPESLIVFGGPHVPDRMEGFFDAHPYIDLAVHGEGEITFAEILAEYVDRKRFEKIPGVSVNSGNKELRPYVRRERIAELDTIPSPYLTGLFDGLLDNDYDFQVIWETNRGCPYACTFCDWGSATMTRLRTFSEDRLEKEIDWFGDHGIQWLYGADANFGLLPRDTKIAEWLASKKRQTGFPGKFRVNYAKNSTERVTQIARTLNAVELDKGITLSMQSMDDETLRIVKRRNLKIASLREFVKEYRQRDIATNTEVILGLPGETLESFVEGIDTLLQAGIHDSIYIYRAQLLPNAELNAPDVRAQYAIETKRTPLIMTYSNPDEDAISEYEETVIGTSTMPHEEWKLAYLFSWLIQTCHAFNLTQVIAIAVHELYDVSYRDFYCHLLEFAEQHPDTVIGQERTRMENRLDELVQGSSNKNVLDEFAPFNWTFEESSFLRLSRSFDRFYEELGPFLRFLETRMARSFDSVVLDDALKVQQSIVIRWDRDGDREVVLGSSLYSFYKNALSLEPTPLERGKYLLRIKDTFRFRGDKRRFAVEVLFRGRRNVKFIYKDIKETRLAA